MNPKVILGDLAWGCVNLLHKTPTIIWEAFAHNNLFEAYKKIPENAFTSIILKFKSILTFSIKMPKRTVKPKIKPKKLLSVSNEFPYDKGQNNLDCEYHKLGFHNKRILKNTFYEYFNLLTIHNVRKFRHNAYNCPDEYRGMNLSNIYEQCTFIYLWEIRELFAGNHKCIFKGIESGETIEFTFEKVMEHITGRCWNLDGLSFRGSTAVLVDEPPKAKTYKSDGWECPPTSEIKIIYDTFFLSEIRH